MLCCIQEQIDKAQSETVVGWAVAITGTIRSAYVTSDGSTSYDEGEAYLLPTRDEAWEFAQSTGNKEKFHRFIEVVPALESVKKQNPYRQGLPTLNGKHPNPFEQANAENPQLTYEQYYLLSQIFIWDKTASLGSPSEATAVLLSVVDKHRPFHDFKQKGVDPDLAFDKFCKDIKILGKETLKNLERSPDYILAFQYAVNPRRATLVLRKLLDIQAKISLPITSQTLDDMGLPIGNDLRSEATATALFEC